MSLKQAACLIPLALLFSSPARAVVEGSPHDLIAHGYDVTKNSMLQERCTRCHLSVSSAPDVLPAVPPVLRQAYGASSLVCFSCHDGTTIVSPDVDASRSAFHPASHGSDLTGEEELVSEELGMAFGEGNRIECLTCHDPHGTGNRPMLRANIGEICLVCHSRQGEVGVGAQNATGNHPQGADPARLDREDVPLKMMPEFMTPFPAPYPLSGGRASAGTHWNPGGHLSEGGAGTIVCVTCHAVHGSGPAPPRSGDLLATDPVLIEADLFCEGCHAGERGDAQAAPPRPNPGGTTTGRTYHPADNDSSNDERSPNDEDSPDDEEGVLETREPEGWPLGTAPSRPILCSTCHRAHGAVERTSLLRRPPAGQGFCEACHERMNLEYHHPLVEEGSEGCAARLTTRDPVTGLRRTCDLCHRAHNAGLGTGREADFIPLLREERLGDAQCLRCHPTDNPTCAENPDYEASHFLGDPTLAETYGDTAPPYRLTPWPESKLFSLYGGDKGQVMICLSCHAFRPGAVVSGDGGPARHLLARSGNPVEWAEEGETGYLCTGCHSGGPKTGGTKGHSHPMMKADAAKLNRTIEPPVTITPNGKVNCDSCHRPHEALTRSGSYILESVSGVNTDPRAIHPKIDFTVLCHLCHDPGKY